MKLHKGVLHPQTAMVTYKTDAPSSKSQTPHKYHIKVIFDYSRKNLRTNTYVKPLEIIDV